MTGKGETKMRGRDVRKLKNTRPCTYSLSFEVLDSVLGKMNKIKYFRW